MNYWVANSEFAKQLLDRNVHAGAEAIAAAETTVAVDTAVAVATAAVVAVAIAAVVAVVRDPEGEIDASNATAFKSGKLTIKFSTRSFLRAGFL